MILSKIVIVGSLQMHMFGGVVWIVSEVRHVRSWRICLPRDFGSESLYVLNSRWRYKGARRRGVVLQGEKKDGCISSLRTLWHVELVSDLIRAIQVEVPNRWWILLLKLSWTQSVWHALRLLLVRIISLAGIERWSHTALWSNELSMMVRDIRVGDTLNCSSEWFAESKPRWRLLWYVLFSVNYTFSEFASGLDSGLGPFRIEGIT